MILEKKMSISHLRQQNLSSPRRPRLVPWLVHQHRHRRQLKSNKMRRTTKLVKIFTNPQDFSLGESQEAGKVNTSEVSKTSINAEKITNAVGKSETTNLHTKDKTDENEKGGLENKNSNIVNKHQTNICGWKYERLVAVC